MHERSKKELFRASEDLFYELWMLHRLLEIVLALPDHEVDADVVDEAERQAFTHTTHIQAQFWGSDAPSSSAIPERFVVEHNALVETFALHARVLLEFFYATPNPRFSDDVRAEHYFLSPATWHTARPDLSEDDYDGIKNRVGKEIAHLTYARQLILPEDKPWPVSWITGLIDDATSAFVSSVDDELIHPSLREAS